VLNQIYDEDDESVINGWKLNLLVE